VEDEASAFYALDPAARMTLVRERFAPLVAIYDGTLEADDDEVVLEGRLGRDHRRMWIRAELEHATLRISVDMINVIGDLVLDRCFDDVLPQGQQWLGDPEHAVCVDNDRHAADKPLARLPPALRDELVRWIDDASISKVVLGSRLYIEPFGFAYESDLTPAHVAELLALVPALVALCEAGGDAVCAFCAGRFVPDRSRTCSHCGARML
jgi:hypothetical protein